VADCVIFDSLRNSFQPSAKALYPSRRRQSGEVAIEQAPQSRDVDLVNGRRLGAVEAIV
jgi:hypothetical protein